MRRIGLIGGTSWVSTIEYYTLLNRTVAARTGGEYPELLISSVNMADVVRNTVSGDQSANHQLFLKAAQSLKGGGAEGLAFCANTSHWFADTIAKTTGMPLVHIGDAVAASAKAQGFKRLAVLGTKPTMEERFLVGRLEDAGFGVMVPDDDDREFIHRAILTELVHDDFRTQTRSRHLEIVGAMAAQGADAIVLACTEIPALLRGVPTPVPTIDTTAVHAEAIADFILGP